MSTIQISRKIFNDVEDALSTTFNSILDTACNDFGVPPFEIMWEPGVNYWRAAFSLQDLRDKVSANQWPCLTLSTGAVVDEHEEYPRTFQGPVAIHIGVFYRFDDPATSDMETITQAVESTLIQILSLIYGLKQKTLTFEKDPPEFANDAWYVGHHASAEYEVFA